MHLDNCIARNRESIQGRRIVCIGAPVAEIRHSPPCKNVVPGRSTGRGSRAGAKKMSKQLARCALLDIMKADTMAERKQGYLPHRPAGCLERMKKWNYQIFSLRTALLEPVIQGCTGSQKSRKFWTCPCGRRMTSARTPTLLSSSGSGRGRCAWKRPRSTAGSKPLRLPNNGGVKNNGICAMEK